MPSTHRSRSQDKNIAWWSKKVRTVGLKCFDSGASRWAGFTLDRLVGSPTPLIHAPDYPSLAEAFGVPLKYFSRALATLVRCGLVTRTQVTPPTLAFHADRLARWKNSAHASRRRLSGRERTRIFQVDLLRCARCGRTFRESQLEVDHVVPVSLLGADVPANWVAMCRPDNRDKL